MPTTKQATMYDVESFEGSRKLQVSKEEAAKLVEVGDLLLTQSVFSDQGEDFNRLHTKAGKLVGYWSGY